MSQLWLSARESDAMIGKGCNENSRKDSCKQSNKNTHFGFNYKQLFTFYIH